MDSIISEAKGDMRAGTRVKTVRSLVSWAGLLIMVLGCLSGTAYAQFVDATGDTLGDTGYGYGVAWGDYDGDGDLDLYLANYATANKLFRNDGGGTFVDATGDTLGDTGNGRGVAWGDYDNDGDLDLYLSNWGEANKLFRNDGGGTFVDVTSGPLGDTGQGRGVAWGDYDNDGDLDLYLANLAGANKLFRNEGDGTFMDDTSGLLGDTGMGTGVAWGDYDNDGDLDLYLTNALGSNKLFRNDGGGTFADATTGPLADMTGGAGVAWGDYDNDGDLDLYVANSGSANKLLRNEGGGTFVDDTSEPLGDTGNGRGVAWGDYDNDGDLDLYLSNYPGMNRLFSNEGGGTFVDDTSEPLGDTGNGAGVAWGDYDDDGDLDLYLANNGTANKLFRNEAAAGQHWLQVKLQGTISNRAGIGARVRVVAGSVSRIREISGGSGYLSQDAMVASFGLGSATSIDSLEVRWPSGFVQLVDPAPAMDGVVTVVEDPGPVGDTGGGVSVAWGDYDNDGDLDLYLANWGESNKLFRNEGGGTFADATGDTLGDTGYGCGVAWGDYDNDGDLDLYLANNGTNKLFRNEGGGTFVDATTDTLGDTGFGQGVAWGDYDNDGDVDLYLANGGQANKLFRNEGGGTFVDATSGPLSDTASGRGVAWGDYDNDGDLDLYLVNYGAANKLLRNEGGGTFVDATSGPLGDTGLGTGLAWGDYDNDGDLDLYLANSGQPNKLLRNDGGGTFVDVTSGPLGDTASGRGVAWGDYDNDGDLDLYLANAQEANKRFRNEGGGTFVDDTPGPMADTGYGYGVAWGDYDNDGDLDLYLANYGTANKLFRNEAAAGQHWVQVKLQGTISNRAGIGARVRVVAGGVSRIREISGGSGYFGQDAMVASFGLGSTASIDSLEVRWPSGSVQLVDPAPAVDGVLTVVEDRAPVVTSPDAVSGEEEGTISFTVTASDLDGDPITDLSADLSTLPSGNDATFTPSGDNTSGTFVWHPGAGKAGTYHVVFTGSNALSGMDTTRIAVVVFRAAMVAKLKLIPACKHIGTHNAKFKAIKFGPPYEADSVQTQISVVGPCGSSFARPISSQAASMPLKGPIVSAPTTAEATVGETLVVDVWASGADTLVADLSELPEDLPATFTVDYEPVLVAPETWCGEPRVLMTVPVTASDPDGDAILELSADLTSLPEGHDATFVVDGTNTSGTFSWTPAASDSGMYQVRFKAANALVRYETAVIRVQSGLVGYWALNGNGQDGARGNALSEMGSVTYVDGCLGQGADIDGTDFGSRLTCAATPLYDFEAGFTAQCWVKWGAVGLGSEQCLMSGVSPDGNQSWELYLCVSGGSCTPGTVGARVRSVFGSSGSVVSSALVNEGEFHHVAVTYDGTNLQLVVDGVADNVLVRGGMNAYVLNLTLGMGVTGGQFGGVLDDVRIYRVARSAAEIASDMDRELGFPTSVPGEQAPRYVDRLDQNRPNPFNPLTEIGFEVERGGRVRLEVFDVRGRLVAKLVDRDLPVGRHRVTWWGRDGRGRAVASGVYYYRLVSRAFTKTRSMVLLK